MACVGIGHQSWVGGRTPLYLMDASECRETLQLGGSDLDGSHSSSDSVVATTLKKCAHS